jgi:hypothetical protein
MSIRSQLTAIATRIIGGTGAWVAPRTDLLQLMRLIAALSPVATDKQLIRVGPLGDGGYLIPDDLQGIEACFSPGVSMVSGFEKQCADAGMAVFLADASVDGPAESHPRFSFTKKFVGITNDDFFMTMDNWVKDSVLGTTSDLLLQIDIEGYEYEVFIGMSDALLRRFRIIVAEFHDLHQLWDRPRFEIASRVFEKVMQTHVCVHIHPNNVAGCVTMAGIEIPRLAEFTFLRRDRILHISPAMQFPHPLDRDNTNNIPLRLPSCWVNARMPRSKRHS